MAFITSEPPPHLKVLSKLCMMIGDDGRLWEGLCRYIFKKGVLWGYERPTNNKHPIINLIMRSTRLMLNYG